MRQVQRKPAFRQADLVGQGQPGIYRRCQRHRPTVLQPHDYGRAVQNPRTCRKPRCWSISSPTGERWRTRPCEARRTVPGTRTYPLEGDAYSITLAKGTVADAGHSDRVSFVQSTLEEFSETEKYDLIFINISWHEARDIDLATKNVRNALKPGGYFVISDFPFPAEKEGLRTIPARVMSGIQYFEAQIDDQLVSTETFVLMLEDYGFEEVDLFIISPVHNVIYGQK
ncbi:MAG TPA: methyltransferase domain-containing protein [Dehalococcoidia bacterium]|nr:methyltransferase domain-containing protein [Dehalococcoidia bacterium]